jgi:aspartate kinase
VPLEGPKAIAFKKGITVINISSGRMLLAYGFLRKIFEIFDNFKTSVDLVATSEVTVSITIDDTSSIDNIVTELEKIGTVNIEKDKCVICIVGQDLWKQSKFITEVFRTLQSIPIRMISLGSSDTNLSLVVPQNVAEDAVKKLHAEFFE